MNRHLSIVIIVGLVLGSCIYQPDGDSFNEIKQKEPTQLSLNFFSAQDTVLLRGALNLNLEFPTNEDLIYYKFYLDDLLIQEDKCCPYSIYLDSRKYKDGFHNLKLELYQKTNSNSLADKLDAEAFILSYIKPAFIDNSQLTSESLKITNIGIEDSVLFIEWTPYTGKGFKNYKVSFPSFSLGETVITDQKKNRINVYEYAGGPITINIYLYAYEQVAFTAKTYNYDIGFKLIQIKPRNGNFEFTWKESPFRAWNGLSIYIYDLQNNAFNAPEYIVTEYLTGSKKSPYLLSYNTPFPFDILVSSHVIGIPPPTYVEINSSNFNSSILTALTQNYKVNQVKFFNDQNFLTIQSHNSLSLVNMDIASVNSTDPNNTTQTYSGNLALSPNGENLFEFKNGEILKLNTSTFESMDQINVEDKVGSYSDFIGLESTDENKVMIIVKQYYEKYYIWDWDTKQIIYQGYIPTIYLNYSKDIEISPDGSRLFDHKSNYTYDLTVNIAERQGSSSLKRLITNSKDEIFYSSGNLIQRKAFPPYSVVKEMPYSKSIQKIISNQNGEFGIMYSEDNRIKIDFLQLDTFQYLGTVNLNNQIGSPENALVNMHDNHLVYQNDKLHVMQLDFLK